MIRRMRFVTMILPVLTSVAMMLGAAGVWAQETAAPPLRHRKSQRRLCQPRPRSIRGTPPGCSSRPRWFWP